MYTQRGFTSTHSPFIARKDETPSEVKKSVKLDEKNRRFMCDLFDSSNNHKGYGYLHYNVLDSNKKLYEFDHIEIPNEFRQENLGHFLANAAFEHASREGWRVKTTCDFLSDKFLKEKENKTKFSKIIAE